MMRKLFLRHLIAFCQASKPLSELNKRKKYVYVNMDINWSNQKVFQHICLTFPEISKQVFIYTPSPAPPVKGGVRLLPLVSAVMARNSDFSDYSGYLHYCLSLKFRIHRQG